MSKLQAMCEGFADPVASTHDKQLTHSAAETYGVPLLSTIGFMLPETRYPPAGGGKTLVVSTDRKDLS